MDKKERFFPRLETTKIETKQTCIERGLDSQVLVFKVAQFITTSTVCRLTREPS